MKIGYADDIKKRLQQLNRSECIPFAFRVYATYEVNSRLSDLKIGRNEYVSFMQFFHRTHIPYWRQLQKFTDALTN